MPPSPECDSFHPGHNVHPIQFFRAHVTPGHPVDLITVIEHHEGALAALVQIDGGPEETWLFHGLPTVRAAVDRWRRVGASLHAYSLLIVGEPDGGGARPCLYPCRTPESWTECATIGSVGSEDPATLTRALGGLLLRPAD